MELNYSPLLQEALQSFGLETSGCRASDEVLPFSPMMPFVWSNYDRMRIKMFYIGQDTNSWGYGFSDFQNCFDQHDLAEYLKFNAENCLPLDARIKYGMDGRTFWHGIHMLQVRMQLGYICNPSNLTDGEKEVIGGLGYGNLNAIETPRTLRYCWDRLDSDKYWVIKNASQKWLDDFRLIFYAFKPDCAVIASWTGDVDAYIRRNGLKCSEPLEDLNLGGLKVQIYRVSDGISSTVVVWTNHPRVWVKLGTAQSVERLGAILEKYIMGYVDE